MKQRPQTHTHRLALYRDAVAIVDDEYASSLSIEEVARRVATSRRQLQRVYAEIGDTTFREYLTAVRMDRAADLLASRQLNVREIAARVGYRQPAHFAKAFQRHHGVSPSAFRRRERQRRAPRTPGPGADANGIAGAGPATPRPVMVRPGS